MPCSWLRGFALLPRLGLLDDHKRPFPRATQIVEAILANFRHLKALHIWGCHRVTECSYRKAPRHVRVFGGMHI
jgi:hypothetical protein